MLLSHTINVSLLSLELISFTGRKIGSKCINDFSSYYLLSPLATSFVILNCHALTRSSTTVLNNKSHTNSSYCCFLEAVVPGTGSVHSRFFHANADLQFLHGVLRFLLSQFLVAVPMFLMTYAQGHLFQVLSMNHEHKMMASSVSRG